MNDLTNFLAMMIKTNSSFTKNTNTDTNETTVKFTTGIEFHFDKTGTIKYMYNNRPAVKS